MKKTKQDNRVSLSYIAERLINISEVKSDKELRKQVKEFKTECVYNLGINTLHNGEK